MLNKLFDGKPPKLEPTGCETVVGVGSSDVLGCIHLPFFLDCTLGSQKGFIKLETTFHVLNNFGPGFALGLDVMKHYGIDTLITENRATMQSTKGKLSIPISFTRSRPAVRGPNPEHSRKAWSHALQTACDAELITQELRCLQRVKLPPKSRKFVKVSTLKGGENISWLFSPRLTEDPARKIIVMGKPGIGRKNITGRKGAGLIVSNLGNVPCYLPRGTVLFDACPAPSTSTESAGFSFHLDPNVDPDEEIQAATWKFDPRDGDEDSRREKKEARAAVEKEVPSSDVLGCHVAHDQSGRPPPQIVDLLNRRKEAFSRDGKPGHVTVEKMKINLQSDAAASLRPQGLRPLAPAKREVERKALREFLDDDVIEPSTSHLSFPVVIVRQGERQRYCIDYRELNKVTIPDCYPMQRADVLFSALGGNKYFSSLDAARGYHQIPIAEEDRWKTAFVTHQGFFQWKTMPFGLRNAPAVFQRLMDTHILGELRWQEALVYIDDVVVFSDSLESHVAALDKIMTNAIKIGLKFSSKKCFFAYPSLKVLGRLISQDGLSVLLDRTKAIRELAPPKTLQDLHRVLGIFGFYRSFIVSFARRAAPLTELTRNLVYERSGDGKRTQLYRIHPDGRKEAISASSFQLEWGRRQQAAFDDLKSALVSPPCLAFPLEGWPYILYVDASHAGISAILHQVQPERRPGTAQLLCLLADSIEDRLRPAQEKDELFGPILEKVLRGEGPEGYELRAGDAGDAKALMLKTQDGWRWCLPKELLPLALSDLHDRLGHGGVERTLAAVKARFWRPGLTVATKSYVESCGPCQRSKKTNQKPAGQMLHDREVRPVAFDTVSMDLVTGLPVTTKGFDAILTIKCLWSNVMLLIPTKSSLTARKLAQLWFDNVTKNGWAPSKIISDRGPQFMSQFWSELQQCMGTTLVYSAAHHQQANPVERGIQTMQTTLRVYCANRPQDWFKHLSLVELTLNSLKSSTTGQAPHDLLYVSRNSPWATVRQELESEPAMLAEARQRVKEAIEARRVASELYRHYYNARHSAPPKYEKGDWVLVRIDERPIVEGDTRLSKLHERHRGPWQIKNVISPVTLELDLPGEMRKISPIFTVDQVKRFHGTPPSAASPPAASPSQPDQDSDSDDEQPPVADAGQPRQSSRLANQPRRRWDHSTHAEVHASAAEQKTREYPIVYFSRQLYDAEKRYNITELELLAVREAVLTFQYYLDGAPEIVVITDHKPLTTILRSSKEHTSNIRVLRFRSALQGFNLKIVYKEGRRHLNADALSRLPLLENKPSFSLDPEQIFEGGPPDKQEDPLNLLPRSRSQSHSLSSSSSTVDTGLSTSF